MASIDQLLNQTKQEKERLKRLYDHQNKLQQAKVNFLLNLKTKENASLQKERKKYQDRVRQLDNKKTDDIKYIKEQYEKNYNELKQREMETLTRVDNIYNGKVQQCEKYIEHVTNTITNQTNILLSKFHNKNQVNNVASLSQLNSSFQNDIHSSQSNNQSSQRFTSHISHAQEPYHQMDNASNDSLLTNPSMPLLESMSERENKTDNNDSMPVRQSIRSKSAFCVCGNKMKTGSKTSDEESFNCDDCGICIDKAGILYYFCDNFDSNIHNGMTYDLCGSCAQKRIQTGKQKTQTDTRNSDKQYKCHFCDKRFKYSSERTVHERNHTREATYKCRFCDKRFKQKSGKISHERNHKGEKPYQCKKCLKRCKNQTILDFHKKYYKFDPEKRECVRL